MTDSVGLGIALSAASPGAAECIGAALVEAGEIVRLGSGLERRPDRESDVAETGVGS